MAWRRVGLPASDPEREAAERRQPGQFLNATVPAAGRGNLQNVRGSPDDAAEQNGVCAGAAQP